ncbi:hypothetical protein LXL04_031811 [Taraxacum kok-saghyz]
MKPLSDYIWQSFNYPTDTLLPEIKLGWDKQSGINRILRSWKTNNDPTTGDCSFKVSIIGFPELLTMNNETTIWRTGPWINGIWFIGVPAMKGVNIMQFELQDNSDEISYSFEMLNSSVYSRLVINSSGLNQRFVWAETTNTWSVFWSFPVDFCDHFSPCGPFGVCDPNPAGFLSDLLEYVDVGIEILIDSQKSPYLKNGSVLQGKLHPLDFHNLEGVLHTFGGWSLKG